VADRNGIVGLIVLDGRVTGEPLVNAELDLVFHLLEQVGLALRNIWLHQQIASNSEMMTDVLRELSSACIVVGHDLKVLHANKSAHRYFGQKSKRTGELDFSDLPQALGAKIYQVLKSGAALGPFRYEAEHSPGTVYRINVVPFQRGNATAPFSALFTAEDLTQAEHLQNLELEAANLRLIKSMSNRLVNEIGNAIVPLSTHHQLLNERFDDVEFRKSLDSALGESVKRITRLNNQMRFLARDNHLELQTFPVGKLIEDAYQEALKHQPAEAAKLQYKKTSHPINLTGDRAALKHVLSEIMLNALQANPKVPVVEVQLHTAPGTGGGQDLQIEVQDNGSGFTTEAAKQALSAFYTTRIVGLGLGLTVSQKIIETHHGRLEIIPPQSGQPGIVRVSLPLEPTISTAA
jgi:nitrogen fixation/metabolism regulation signal transduction histidine kinase